jgi:hypothetical protein
MRHLKRRVLILRVARSRSIRMAAMPINRLTEVGERLKAKDVEHSKLADGWAERLDKINEIEADAIKRAEAALKSREDDIKQLDNIVRALSNLGGSDSE